MSTPRAYQYDPDRTFAVLEAATRAIRDAAPPVPVFARCYRSHRTPAERRERRRKLKPARVNP
jgi:hypothetical protein